MGSPYTDYTIIVIRKENIYFNTELAVDTMRGMPKDILSMGSVTIYMLYVIRVYTLHNAPPESVLSWGVCCIYFLFRSDYATTLELYLRLY